MPGRIALVLLLLVACTEREERTGDGNGRANATADALKAAERAGAEKAEAEGAANSPPASGAPPAAAPGMCRDFATCREACAARRSGACVRMERRARADRDRREAEKVATELCTAGHPEACHVRSLLLRADKRGAARARTRACALGDGPACAALADAAGETAKGAELRGRANALLDRQCQHDDPYACAAIARSDPTKARWHYDKACRLGDEESCLAVAELLGAQPELQAKLLDRACELGEPRACERLASALLDGRLPADAARAAALKKRAEELAPPPAPK